MCVALTHLQSRMALVSQRSVSTLVTWGFPSYGFRYAQPYLKVLNGNCVKPHSLLRIPTKSCSALPSIPPVTWVVLTLSASTGHMQFAHWSLPSRLVYQIDDCNSTLVQCTRVQFSYFTTMPLNTSFTVQGFHDGDQNEPKEAENGLLQGGRKMLLIE